MRQGTQNTVDRCVKVNEDNGRDELSILSGIEYEKVERRPSRRRDENVVESTATAHCTLYIPRGEKVLRIDFVDSFDSK